MFQFTHPGRGATPNFAPSWLLRQVSIHAPREGCDSAQGRSAPRRQRFNSRTPGGVRREGFYRLSVEYQVSIHAPREGCDKCVTSSTYYPPTFQFTHPGRGATSCAYVRSDEPSFNSRTPGGVRLFESALIANAGKFQFTHPGRGATLSRTSPTTTTAFQFTHPGRGATGIKTSKEYIFEVSIHAPREGCDYEAVEIYADYFCVSIHAPREGCDRRQLARVLGDRVSIHAPREGCDSTQTW